MKRFWIALTLCLFSVNSLCASLYGGAETLDDGSGFISFSPLIDMVFWGALILVFGLAALFCWRRYRPGLPSIPRPLCYPAAYLATLAGLSVLILLMGICRVLYQFSPIHLPIWGYIILMTVLYLLSGFFWGRKWGDGFWSSLLWCAVIAALLLLMGTDLIRQAEARELDYLWQLTDGSFHPVSPQTLLERFPGGILARLNLPACVVMDNYYYAYVTLDGMVALRQRELVVFSTCLLPPLLFTFGWLSGRRYHPSKGNEESNDE